ncbi:MAG: hypothetical protein JRH16_04480 [Deltaproteobacteria bacterium]|nr:hypothetical protein [Deltaproteobacteria bacterium]MBW2361326.1 hypothetical protein [Deltaproteobacteria bacterium]
MTFRSWLACVVAGSVFAAWGASAYPGGTPSYQTDVAPYCAGCHSSRSIEMLDGSPDRAAKELAERKHVAVVLSGQKGYASLTEPDRQALADQIRALDVASTVSLAAPARVTTGQDFEVRISVTGGAGPVVGVALVDRPHRWHARPLASAGWQVAAPPRITGPDGQPQTEWLARRPEGRGRNISYVNVTDIASDSAAGRWSSASVVFTLRAPTRPGQYPLAAAYLYGTEKSTILGYTTNALGWKEPRGGMGGPSGRVLFSDLYAIEVVPPTAPTVSPVVERPAPAAPTPPITVVE